MKGRGSPDAACTGLEHARLRDALTETPTRITASSLSAAGKRTIPSWPTSRRVAPRVPGPAPAAESRRQRADCASARPSHPAESRAFCWPAASQENPENRLRTPRSLSARPRPSPGPGRVRPAVRSRRSHPLRRNLSAQRFLLIARCCASRFFLLVPDGPRISLASRRPHRREPLGRVDNYNNPDFLTIRSSSGRLGQTLEFTGPGPGPSVRGAVLHRDPAQRAAGTPMAISAGPWSTSVMLPARGLGASALRLLLTNDPSIGLFKTASCSSCTFDLQWVSVPGTTMPPSRCISVGDRGHWMNRALRR